MADQNQTPNAPPSVLPPEFSGWDATPANKQRSTPPTSLPANFSQWDASSPKGKKEAVTPPATLPSDHKDWDKKPTAASMRAATPTWGNRILDTVRNTAIGHSIQTVFPGAPEWMKPTTTVGTEESRQEQQQLLKPEHLVQGSFRKSPSDKAGLGENLAVGVARFVGEMTTGENLALMAVPIGEVAGIFGVAGKVIVPRLLSAGFSVQMIKGLYDQALAYKSARKAGDDQAAEQIMGEMIATVPFLFAAGAHATGVHFGKGASAKVHAEEARKNEIFKVKDVLQKNIEKRTAEIKSEMDSAVREGRESRHREEAGKRESVTQTADQISRGREETWNDRQAAEKVPTEKETSRAVDSIVDQSGHVSYPAQFWGETNSFGVGSVGDSHSIYRQTPRGVEWLDRNGNFTESPESLYWNNDPAAADTVARLSALKTDADNVAAQESPTPEELNEAESIGEIRRALIDGEIDAKEAQKQAGIAEKIRLPDEHLAAREGRLNGPFSDKSASEYASDVEGKMRESGSPEEEIQATLESLPEIARVQTEANLHHVYQPGDYIVSKKGVKWTLDAKGLLHSSDGETIPLMKRGKYSNQAMQIAGSGRVGYGTKTRAERRADFAKIRGIKNQISSKQEEFDREMRIAQQNAGLEMSGVIEPSARELEAGERAVKFLGRPPVSEEIRKSRQERRASYKASKDPDNIINQLAKKFNVTPDEVMRIGLSERMPNTPEGKAASLEVGDRVSDSFKPGRPWIVGEKNGQTFLRSGQSNPLPFDRLNPSPRVLKILERGEVTHDRDWTDEEKNKVAFEKPYLVYQKFLSDEVKERAGKPVPEPVTKPQAKAESEAAQRRTDATESIAEKEMVNALNPATTNEVEAEAGAVKASESIKLAEEAYAQQAEIESKTVPEDQFPQRAPASIGYKGSSRKIVQNNREFPFHYELLPLDGLSTSHHWEQSVQVPNPDYPSVLQPRTISEDESLQNAMRAEKYDFRQYSDTTINGSMGPAIVDRGGQVVGGNTRIEIMKRYLKNMESIADVETREAAKIGFDSAMRKLAQESGITRYPEDGGTYAVVRMLDKPIETTREAADLGRLFNKSVGVEISRSAKGISYAKSFTDPQLEDIGRRVEANDGLIQAMGSDPEFFRKIVTDTFQVLPEEYANWFRNDPSRGQVLNDTGRDQFIKALLGRVISDTTVLNRIEGKTPYRALERAFGYAMKMKALPERNISGKIEEAVKASADTIGTDAARHSSRDPWMATYAPEQTEFSGMESDIPPEPDRMVEAIWRSLNASQVASPRVFNDRLKAFIGEETAKGGWIFGEHYETPVEAFNRAFSKELKEVAHSRGDKHWELSQAEYDAALQGREISDKEVEEARKSEEKIEVKPEVSKEETPKFGPPPKSATPEAVAEKRIAEAKTDQGYVTPQQLREFLESQPATKEHVSELLRTAQKIAEYVYESDPPEGVDKKQALDWILRERVGRIEEGERKGVRGEYVDPALEKGLANGILRLHKAADPTSFIHEFAHVVFPLLSDEDLKAIDTIGKRAWDGKSSSLKGDVYASLSEKLAHGMEQFLRDENPTGFTDEVKNVLRKIKGVMRKTYLAFKGDPLSEFQNTEESRGVFAKMFGITDFDVADVWRDEVKKARAEEKKIKRPEEEPHPLVKMARELGGNGLRESIDGKVVDEVGDRVDPKKPVAVITFPSEKEAVSSIAKIAGGGGNINGAELIQGDDGIWGVKINTATKPPRSVLYQPLPERHLGLQLEDLEKRMKELPSFKTFERRLLQMQIESLKNRIRADHNVEERKEQIDPELPKQVLQEVRNAKETDRGRKPHDGVSGVPKPPRVGGIPQPPKLGVSGHAATERRGATTGRSISRAPVSLENVKAVALEPLAGVRGEPVGTLAGEKFDQKAWVEGLKKAGLPESTPPPTYTLDPKTATQLIYPGQKQIVQTAMSALEQGDGVVMVTPAGTGKSKYTCPAIIKEFLRGNPEANVLVISKNRSILKAASRSAAANFGLDYEMDVPKGESGIYAASFMKMMGDDAYKKTPWDLVVVDEAGEARRWYDEGTKQGQLLRDVVANSKKAVYASATPFHSPQEYGYLDKLNLWPKGQFDKWIEDNFAHEKVGDKIVARLDPGKQAKLRAQLIERGQFVSQAISYDGYNAHFGVVPVTDSMKRGLDRIREGFARARDQFVRQGKQGLANKTAAFEAVYTKNFLERERLPQAIELAKQARSQGWRVLFFSEHTADDLFRRERREGEEPSTYQQLDDAMGGQLSRIIPAYPSIYDQLFAEFGAQVGDYSGGGNTDAAREAARTGFLKGEVPMLYASYAGGGIGVDMHDADYPELNVKGGERPIVAIYLGPPYSGVLLEQAMGRPWRFGVKSDVHAVFLATDSEPDIRLMQTKIGPRMKALRAAVLGEKDSLGNVMSTYTDEEKVRERQDQLAYAEGNEMKVNATQFQVRSKSRNVGIQDWSAIIFPSAEEAKHKGMKYGEAVAGGDWSSLYQSKFELRPPENSNTAKAKETIDRIGNTVSSGNGVPEELQSLDPEERRTAVGLAAATATEEAELPIDADKANLARISMDSSLRQGAIVPYIGITFSQEVGMVNVARLDGKQEVGYTLRRMNRAYGADWDQRSAQSWQYLRDSFDRYGIEPTDENVREMSLVLEGKRSTDNPKMQGLVNDIRDMMKMAHEDMGKAGVKVTAGKRLVPYTEFPDDPHYFPHRIDFDYEMEDPSTGGKIKVKDLLKIDERRAKAILDRIPELKPYSFQQIMAHLERNHPRTVKQRNVHFAREVNFPFIKRDYNVLLGYFDQVAQAISAAKNFGPEDQKLNEQIKKIRNPNGRETLNSMFRSALQPQSWDGTSSRLYNAIVTYEGATKMTFAAPKVPFHLVHVPMVMKGRVMPLLKAFKDVAFHPREVFDNAAYVGTIARQSNASEMLFGERNNSTVRTVLRREGFEAAYKLVRVISGQAAKNYLDVWAIRDLRKGGASAGHTRRMLQDVFLLGDKGIDEALDRGRFTPEEINRAEVAFTNMAAFSGRGDPLQMPKFARLEQPKIASHEIPVIAKAIRLTYSLQSFSVKTLSALREHLFDEVVVHHNLKPLRYALIAYPLVGTALNLVNTGSKHTVQRGLEGLMGKDHKKDSWDTYLAYLKDTFVEHPDVVKFLKWYIDSYTLSTALETTKIVTDHFLDMVTGKWQKSDDYWIPDLIQHMVGPFYQDLYNAAQTEHQVEKTEGTKHPRGWKNPREAKEIRHGLEEQVPAFRPLRPAVDWAEGKLGIKPPPK